MKGSNHSFKTLLSSTSKNIFLKNTRNCLFLTVILIFTLQSQLTAQNSVLVSGNCNFVVNSFITNVSCFGEEDGQIELNVTNANGNVNIFWVNLPIDPGNSTLVDNLAPDTFEVEIVDGTGCFEVHSFVITQPPPLVATPNDTTLCHGGGQVDLLQTVSGGNGNYSSNITAVNGLGCLLCAVTGHTVDTTSIISVQVTDSLGCATNTDVLVDVLDPLTVSLDVENETCGNDGEIAINASGGSGNFLYSLDSTTFTTDSIFSNLQGMLDYTVFVVDGQQCTAAQSTFVAGNPLPEATTATADATCNNFDDGIVEITILSDLITGYALNDSTQIQDSPVFENLEAGTYAIYVQDTYGCVKLLPDSAYIFEPAALSATLNITNVTCPGEDDGTMSIVAQGGNNVNQPYIFSLDGTDFMSTDSFTNLDGGPHFVIVQDSLGCELTEVFTVQEGEAPTFGIETNPSCPNESTGSIVIVEAGKLLIEQFHYSLDTVNFSPSPEFNDLPPGEYVIYIKFLDDCCVYEEYLFVGEVSAPSVAIEVTAVSCQGILDGTATIDITNGPLENYEFSLDSLAFFSTNELINLAAGKHDLYVRDTFDCVYHFNFDIPDAMPMNLVIIEEEVTCNGGEDGTITVIASGGNPPYKYSMDSLINYQPDSIFTNLSAGDYSLFVRDANTCITSQQHTLNESDALLIDFSVIPEKCSEGNGVAACFVTGGTAPYSFLWSTGDTLPIISELEEALYEVTVTDALACEEISVAEVQNEAAPMLSYSSENVSCFGLTDGSIYLNVTDGTPPFDFFWSNGATTKDNPDLDNGQYSVTVLDANNCEISTSPITITEPPEIILSDSTWYDGHHGFVDLSVSGGILPYSYLWSNGAVSEDVGGLAAPATYAVTVTDGINCKKSKMIDIIVTSTFSPDYSEAISVFPIPVQTELNVGFDLEKAAFAEMEIVDLKGVLIKKYASQMIQQNVISLDVSDLPEGLFLLKILMEGKSVFKKIVK